MWVVNAGISHQEDTPTSQIGPWVQVHPGLAAPDAVYTAICPPAPSPASVHALRGVCPVCVLWVSADAWRTRKHSPPECTYRGRQGLLTYSRSPECPLFADGHRVCMLMPEDHGLASCWGLALPAAPASILGSTANMACAGCPRLYRVHFWACQQHMGRKACSHGQNEALEPHIPGHRQRGKRSCNLEKMCCHEVHIIR